MTRRGIAVFAAIVLVTTCFVLRPAGATPPRKITVEDSLFGISKTHLFLLRSVRDNLETRGTTLTDIVLVAKSIGTGHEAAAWPVRRILATGDPFTSRAPEDVQDLALADRVNPFDVLAAHHGRPVTESAARSPTDALLQQWNTEQFLAIGRWSNAADYKIGRRALAAQLSASLATARRMLPAYQNGYDPLLHAAFSRHEDCRTGRLYLAPLPDHLAVFARLDCFDPEELVNISVYLAVPIVENN